MAVHPSLLPALAGFVQIARQRSVTRAAAEMGVTRAALSQQLKLLEQRLNVRLMHRTTRSMSLTEEGQHLFDALQPALAAIGQAVEGLSETKGNPSGVLRVNTSRVAARLLLEPHLSDFLTRYPDLKLELVMADGFSSIVAEGMDAGIRLGESLAEGVVAVPVTPMMQMAVVGSPSYFERHGVPQEPADLDRHNCLAYRFTSSGAIDRWAFTSPETDDRIIVFEPQGSATFNDDEQMLSAALQGVGLIKHLDLCVRKQLAEGTLVRVLQPWCKPFPGFFLYVPSRAQLPAKTRALMDFLVAQRRRFGRSGRDAE